MRPATAGRSSATVPPWVRRDRKAPQVRKVRLELTAQWVRKVPQARLVLQVPKARRALMALWVHKVRSV
jgi:hypothetical protein